jgi:hypothetical protein
LEAFGWRFPRAAAHYTPRAAPSILANIVSSIETGQMRRFIIIPLAITSVTCGLLGIDALARHGTDSSGLDYWNYFDESDRFKTVTENGRDLDCELQKINQRREMINLVAISLCNGRISVGDAISSTQALVQNSSYNCVHIRTVYISFRYLQPNAAERDTFACFLLLWIKRMQVATEQSGDKTSAIFLSDRLIKIYGEMKVQSLELLPAILDPVS